MANIKVQQQQEGTATVLTYEIDNKAFEELDTLRFDGYDEEWAKFILANRNNTTGKAIHHHDIVIGPIADDRVGLQLWKYENQYIDLPTLVRKLKYMRGITIQYFFGTEKAISLLKRIEI